MVMLRVFISNMTRIWMVSSVDWIDLASVALNYLRSDYPILVGGFAGLAFGDFKSFLSVCSLSIDVNIDNASEFSYV
jgi:hypothetical protein